MYLQEALKKTGKAHGDGYDEKCYVYEKDGSLWIHLITGAKMRYLSYCERYNSHDVIKKIWLPYEEPKCEWCEMIEKLGVVEITLSEYQMVYGKLISLLKQGCKEHGCGGGE